jgi:hypothetical protein
MPDETTSIRLTVDEHERVTVSPAPPAGSSPPDDPYSGDLGSDDSYAGVPFAVWRDYLGQTVALADVKRDAIARGVVKWRDLDVDEDEPSAAEDGSVRDADSLSCPACGGELVAGWAQLAGAGRFIHAEMVVATEDSALQPRVVRGDLAGYQCRGCNGVFIP